MPRFEARLRRLEAHRWPEPEAKRRELHPAFHPIAEALKDVEPKSQEWRALMDLYLMQASKVQRGRPLVPIPQEVIDLARHDPGAKAFHQCEDCALSVQQKYFDRCPGCRGHTGWDFFHLKNEITLEKLQANIDASRGYPNLAAELEALRDRKLDSEKSLTV